MVAKAPFNQATVIATSNGSSGRSSNRRKPGPNFATPVTNRSPLWQAVSAPQRPQLNPVATPLSEPALTAPDEISRSITQTWTDQAIKCYVTCADCSNCEIPLGNYSFTCQMNKVVPILLDTLGQPETQRIKKLFPQGLIELEAVLAEEAG